MQRCWAAPCCATCQHTWKYRWTFKCWAGLSGTMCSYGYGQHCILELWVQFAPTGWYASRRPKHYTAVERTVLVLKRSVLKWSILERSILKRSILERSTLERSILKRSILKRSILTRSILKRSVLKQTDVNDFQCQNHSYLPFAGWHTTSNYLVITRRLWPVLHRALGSLLSLNLSPHARIHLHPVQIIRGALSWPYFWHHQYRSI